jgi:hypothetical protein
LNDSTLNAEYGNNLHDVPHDSAKGAEYESQGKREARRPWIKIPKMRAALKGRNIFGLSGLHRFGCG